MDSTVLSNLRRISTHEIIAGGLNDTQHSTILMIMCQEQVKLGL